MNRTQTGRHINNVAEAAQVSAGHGGDTFKAPTMAYHSPAIVEPLNTGYSHTLDDYAYQQTVSSQLHARQVAESTLISNPFAAEDDFYNYIRNDYYYEVAREETINNLIACNKSELTLYGIEKATLQNQVSDYEALYYETQGFYAKQQRLYSCMSQSIVGIGQSIKGAGDALGDSWYADFSNLKSTVDWVSGDISFSEYCQIVENNEKTKRSIKVGFYNGVFEKVVNGNPVVQTQNLIGTVQYICTGDTSVLDVTGNFNKQKDEFLIETFNLNEEHFYNGKSAANTTWMVGELLLSLYCIRASSSTPSLSDTPIADPYRMSYSGNAQVQMPGFTSTAQTEAFFQLRAARAQASDNHFSIDNWDGYPDGPKPDGPFKILGGEEYSMARKAANTANSLLHRQDPSLKGMQIHEIHPVKFGGSPTDLSNKLPLTPIEHAAYTTWWNKVLKQKKG